MRPCIIRLRGLRGDIRFNGGKKMTRSTRDMTYDMYVRVKFTTDTLVNLRERSSAYYENAFELISGVCTCFTWVYVINLSQPRGLPTSVGA